MERNRGRGIFIYVVMILAFLMAYYYISRRDVDVEPAYSYAAFQKDLADGQVEAVEIKPNTQVPTGQIAVTLKSKGTEQFFDTDVNAVREMVETKYPAVRVTVRNVPQESLFASTILPVLLMIGALFILMLFMSRSAGGGANSQMMNFGKSRARMYSGDGNKITFADVAGLDEEKEDLAEIVDFLKDPGKYTKVGARIPKGVILVGPPGTGKP